MINDLISQLREYTIRIPTFSTSKQVYMKGVNGKIYPFLLQVFIENNKVVAVSNVENELNIKDTIKVRRLAQDCIDRSNELIAMAKCNKLTLDTNLVFSVRENSSIVFEKVVDLKDKACFMHPITKRCKEVKGFILKYGQNPLPLNELRYIPVEGYYE